MRPISRAFHLFCMLAGCAVAAAGSVSAQTVYVHHAATGAGNGASWFDAYTDLQVALQSTTRGQLWVAAGTYHAGPAGQQLATFQLRDGVEIYGGFAGYETQLSQRDVAANPTILSGDIDRNDTYGSGAQWWRFGWNFNSGNSFHIVTGSGTGRTAILDGVTLFAGLGAGPATPTYHGGGGLFIDGGSPTIRNCTFKYNGLGFGSAALLHNCNSTFESCIIRDGYTINSGRGGITSGVYAHGASTLTFTDCDFINHYYVATLGQGYGAAVHLGRGCSGTFLGCDFIGNQTGNWFAMGDPDGAYGAGIYNFGNHLVVDRCTFVDNFAHGGAGIYTWSGITLSNSLFARNRVVDYPVTSVVSRGNFGAGFASRARAGETTTVSNCTFVDNNGDKGAGLAAYCQDAATVRNSILFHNFADSPLPGEDPIWILKQQIVGNYDLANSCVEGLLMTEPGEDPPSASGVPDCIDTDPLFASVAARDYRLLPASPCISAGDDVAAVTPSDLLGNQRIRGVVDMGCYEFQGVAQPSLVGTNLVQGERAWFAVRNAAPAEVVVLLYSLTGIGRGPCLPPPSTACIELLYPFEVFAILPADSSGAVRVALTLPAYTPLIDFHQQALILRGPLGANSVTTNSISATIQPKP